MTWLALLLALLPPPVQYPTLQFGGLYPGVPWTRVLPYITQKAPRPARCRKTVEAGSDPRTRTCVVRRLLLTNDLRPTVTFTVDDSSGSVISIVVAWRPPRDRDRRALIDSLTATYGPPGAADTSRQAAEWTQGPIALKVTARPLPGTTEAGVADPIVVMLISTPLRAAADRRLRGAPPPTAIP